MEKNEVIEKTLTKVADSDINEVEREDAIEEDIVQIVSFSLLNDVEYGIDILSIHEILRVTDISRLPNAPDFVLGVLNLRGNVIPVVNVRMRFGYSRMEYSDDTRIIVVGINNKLVGLLIDKVYQVIRIPLRNISSPSRLIEGVSTEFIQGVGRMEDRLIIILKLDNMLFNNESEDDES